MTRSRQERHGVKSHCRFVPPSEVSGKRQPVLGYMVNFYMYYFSQTPTHSLKNSMLHQSKKLSLRESPFHPFELDIRLKDFTAKVMRAWVEERKSAAPSDQTIPITLWLRKHVQSRWTKTLSKEDLAELSLYLVRFFSHSFVFSSFSELWTFLLSK